MPKPILFSSEMSHIEKHHILLHRIFAILDCGNFSAF